MTFTKSNTCCVVVASALLLSALACSATPPTAPSTALKAVVIVPTGEFSDWQSGQERGASAFAVDARGVYTDITAQAAWRSAVGRVAVGQPVTTTGPISYLTSVPLRAASSGSDRITATYQGMTDSIDVTVNPFQRPRPYLDVRLSGGSQNSQQEFGSRSALILANTDSFFGTVTAASTLESSNPNIAVIEGTRIRMLAPGHFTLTATYNGITGSALIGVLPLGVIRF